MSADIDSFFSKIVEYVVLYVTHETLIKPILKKIKHFALIHSKEENTLEAHPIKNNSDLWDFQVQSKDVNWTRLIYPIHSRSSPVFLGDDFDMIKKYTQNEADDNRMQVLICHDMMGCYLEDRFFSSSRKFDDYRFIHWSGVDYFCYFSHQYVTIPPSNWINAAHKHGVSVLGTFITEWDDGKKRLMEVLESTETVDKTTEALIKCCKHFKFEGWLINIECEVPQHKIHLMEYFLSSLKEKVSSEIQFGKVFWYDSVVNSGKLSWQNSINDRNVDFFKKSDGIFLNYNWSDKHIKETDETLAEISSSKRKAFFGIDIFGRGQVGGFETHKTLSRITNFSVAFFATGWVFEKLDNIRQKNGNKDTNKMFLERNEFFWKLLWKYMPTFPYETLPFTTSFCVGSGHSFFRNGRKVSDEFFKMSTQSLQPSVPVYQNAERYFEEALNGGSCLRIVKENQIFRLFLTNFKTHKNPLLISYAFKTSQQSDTLDVVLRLESENDSNKECYTFLGNYVQKSLIIGGRCYLSPLGNDLLQLIIHQMKASRTTIEISPNLYNGWSSRYYLLFLEEPVVIKDVGVLYKRSQMGSDGACLLGGIHINLLDSRVRIPESYVNMSVLDNLFQSS